MKKKVSLSIDKEIDQYMQKVAQNLGLSKSSAVQMIFKAFQKESFKDIEALIIKMNKEV